MAVNYGGQIYTSSGVLGAGGQASFGQFQYIGNGAWQALLPSSATPLAGGLTTNIVLSGGTKTLVFTNGILKAVQ